MTKPIDSLVCFELRRSCGLSSDDEGVAAAADAAWVLLLASGRFDNVVIGRACKMNILVPS